MYFLIVILIGFIFIILINLIINKSSYLLKKIHNFKIYFKRNKIQKLFYHYEKNKDYIKFSNKTYIKLNNYIFSLKKTKNKLSKIIKNDISHLIIIFFSKTSKYCRYSNLSSSNYKLILFRKIFNPNI